MGKTAAMAQPQAISGLGGIGKTQIAVEYVYRYKNDYQAILWIKAESRESIISDIVSVAYLLNLPEKEIQEQDRIVEAFKRWLQEQTDWLLIFDNVDDPTLVQDILPITSKGHIILTTRAYAMGRLAQRIDLDTLGLVEGVRFLRVRANLLALDAPVSAISEEDRFSAEEIVRELGGLPLALDQAGAYIEETNRSLASYLDLYRSQRYVLLQRRGESGYDHPEPISTTLSISFKKVEKANLLAAELLRFCAFLYPNDIPEGLITENTHQLGPAFQHIVEDPFALDAAIAEIRKYSLVERDTRKGTLSIHRLVQNVLRDEIDGTIQKEWAERAIRAVNHSFPPIEVEFWRFCQMYLPHALVCASHIAQWDMVFPEAVGVLSKSGLYLSDRAQYQESELLLQRALTINERVQGLDHLDTAATLDNLALLYAKQDKYEQAEPLYQRALAIRERVLGPEHPDTASIRNNLAGLYRKQGRYKQAEPLLRRALMTQERILGPEHPDTATTLNNLTELYAVQSKYEEAEALYQWALAARERILGPEHLDTVRTIYNLANLYQNQHKYEQAEPLYERALSIQERVLGPEHPDTVHVRENYTNLLQKMKK